MTRVDDLLSEGFDVYLDPLAPDGTVIMWGRDRDGVMHVHVNAATWKMLKARLQKRAAKSLAEMN